MDIAITSSSSCMFFHCNIIPLVLIIISSFHESLDLISAHRPSIECEDEEAHYWLFWDIYELNGTATTCNIECSLDCICILDEVNITSNCTDSDVSVTRILYPSDVKAISWADSTLDYIRPKSFLRFRSTLEILQLSNTSLQYIHPDLFFGLTNLKVLDLYYNSLTMLFPGTFKDLARLKELWLNYNDLSTIPVGIFRGLKSLVTLMLEENFITNIDIGALEDLVQLTDLYMYYNMLSEIKFGVFRGLKNLKMLDLVDNQIYVLESGCFDGLNQLKYLHLALNRLSEMQAGTLSLANLEWLDIVANNLTNIDPGAFGELSNLSKLLLSENNFTTLHPDAFKGLTNVDEIQLDHNQLQYLPEDIFHNLRQLRHLNLTSNDLTRIPSKLFLHTTSLETLDLTNNPLLWIEDHALAVLNKTAHLVVSSYAPCCFTSAQCVSPPRSPYLTCKRLLSYDILRIFIWFVCSAAIFGNILVIFSKIKQKKQRNKVQLILITNLAISDFFMGVYLAILLSADLTYKEYFPTFSDSWRSSVLCRVAGALSVLSSEASTFFITLITIDRFLGVKYMFSKYRLGTKSTRISAVILWLIAVGIGVSVFVLSQTDSDIYAVSEICVGLPISRSHTYEKNQTQLRPNSAFYYEYSLVNKYIQNGSRVSMIFSIVLFTCVNLACFVIVGYCYLAIFIYIKQTAKESGRSPNSNEEIRIAVKMSLIVLTDFCCWVPIAFLSILVQAGLVEVDPVAYAWIATFVLPINSSINPFLYTLASGIWNKMKTLSRHSKTKQTEEERLPMNATSRSRKRKRMT